MFSTGEYDYIKGLTLNYYNQGYQHYLCITNNPTGYNSTNNVYDIYCYYSREPMTLNDYQLKLPSSTKKCSFDSNNYSENNTIDKLICEDTSFDTITLDTKEFIYSNIGNHSNIIADYSRYNLVFLSILTILILTFLVRFVSKIVRS